MKKFYRNILTAIIITISTNCLEASPQVPDYIVFEDDTIPTYNLLAEQFLQNHNPEEDKLFGLSFRNTLNEFGGSFNCWRGYQAIYKVENDSLFICDIIECHSINKFDKSESIKNLKKLFGQRAKNDKVFIDWFSGVISFPIKSNSNKIIRWDGVFERIFQYETIITVDKGVVTSKKKIENYIDSPDRINREIDDTISNVLFQRIQDYKWSKLDKIDCSEVYRIGINKNGEIGFVEMNLSKEDLEDLFEKNECRHCINSVKKAVKGLEFDIIKRKGIPIEEVVYIELWFEENGTIENWTD